MLCPVKRGLVLGAAWTASAAAAVGLGFLAVSLVGASASPGPLASTSTPTTTPTSGTVSPSGEMATVGGTVFASCDGAAATLASAPAPGWWVDDSSDQGEVEFRDGSQKVEIRTVCVDGGPQFTVEGPRADDGGGGGPDPGTTPAPSSPASPSADDHGGRGSDDGPGDDSSGRGGGGHGSDD
jgi:hypothetical protein